MSDKRKEPKIVGEFRQAIRKAERGGMSRRAIAAKAHMAPAQFGRIARGVNLPRLDTAARIASALGLSLRLLPK